MSLGKKTVTE